jgi:hypothetical protein
MKLKQFFFLFVVSAVFYGVTSGVAVQLASGQPVEKSIFEGVFFAIVMGLFQAFLVVREWISIPFEDKQEFMAMVTVYLTQLGYDLEAQRETHFYLKAQTTTVLTYAPRSRSEKRKIVVRIKGNVATIMGPKKIVNLLGKSLSPVGRYMPET